VACGASAVAGTITEGTAPATADFSGSPTGFLLPVGTTLVNGIVGGNLPNEGGTDFADFFEFQGLTAGGSYTLTGLATASESGVRLAYFTSGPTTLGNMDIGEAAGSPLLQNFIAPADGDVVVKLFPNHEGGLANGGYSVGLSAGTPEPATLGGVGLGLGAIALAWRRRRAQS